MENSPNLLIEHGCIGTLQCYSKWLFILEQYAEFDLLFVLQLDKAGERRGQNTWSAQRGPEISVKCLYRLSSLYLCPKEMHFVLGPVVGSRRPCSQNI
jgi:hypothetical protein